MLSLGSAPSIALYVPQVPLPQLPGYGYGVDLDPESFGRAFLSCLSSNSCASML